MHPKKSRPSKSTIDPKNLMAVERATTALIGTAISLIVLGLERQEINTDKPVYFWLAIFVALIGAVLLLSMLII